MVIELLTDNFEIEKNIHGFDDKVSKDELYAIHQPLGKKVSMLMINSGRYLRKMREIFNIQL